MAERCGDCQKAMLKNGFELIRCFRIKNDERRVEYCFAYKGVSIDLFFMNWKEILH